MKRYSIVRPMTWCLLALYLCAGRLLTGCSGGDNGGGGGGGVGGGNCVSGQPGASAPHYRVVDLGALGTQGGVTCSRPVGPEGLNAGVIVGGVDLGGGCSENDAVFWTINTTASSIAPTPLPGASGGGLIADAHALNAGGQIVGDALQGANLTNAVVVWPNTLSPFTHLSDLPGADESRANSINNAGLIVGASNSTNDLYVNPGHALYWDNTNGLLDLNNLIPANSGWTLLTANAISDAGLIVGAGNLNGTLHGYLLAP
jgi:hypothetical protein